MSDPTLRRKYADFLSQRRGSGAPRQQAGQDRAVAVQGMNAQEGQRFVRPESLNRQNSGQRLQEYYRNRGTEQGGVGKPAAPSTVPYSASRRY